MLLGHASSVVNQELRVNLTPTHAPPHLLSDNVYHRQMQHFQKGVIRWKDGLRFRCLPELPIDSYRMKDNRPT